MTVGEDVVAAVAGVKGCPTGPLVLEITDFSPSQDHQVGGGTKVLICLGNEIPKHLQGNTIKVYFMYLYCSGVGLSGVSKCNIPNCPLDVLLQIMSV
jgi:hypothetical protein